MGSVAKLMRVLRHHGWSDCTWKTGGQALMTVTSVDTMIRLIGGALEAPKDLMIVAPPGWMFDWLASTPGVTLTTHWDATVAPVSRLRGVEVVTSHDAQDAYLVRRPL